MVGPVINPSLAAMAAEPVPRAANEALAGFEALVVQHMLKAGRPEGLKADGLAGALSGGAGDWQDLVDRHLARLIAAGAPFGLARQLGATVAGAEGAGE
jgi:Rod binding domain-containing protein